MTRVSPPQNSFSAGELSPLLHWRFDYARYQSGLRTCRGFLPLREGGITRAPGTLYRGRTRNDARARLIAFEFAADDAIVLELTSRRMRFWRYGAPVLKSGVPYELVTPWEDDDIARLQWVQSADVIYLVDGQRPMQKLSRRALDDWSLQAVSLATGPFRALNSDDTFTVQASAETGAVTLTASRDLFDFAHVGSLFQLEPTDWTDVPLWTSDTTVTVGDRVRSDGNVYELVEGNTTGVNRPVHDKGVQQTEIDPVVKWRYLGDETGIVRIDSIVSPTQVTGVVLRRVPQACVDSPTWSWAEAAFSNVHGWPACIEIHQQRLCLAATGSEPRTIWFSAVGDFEDFLPSIEPDGAFAYAIAGHRSVNRILWLRRGRAGLHIGALGEEYSTRVSSGDGVLSATTTEFGFDSAIGSAPVQPLAPQGDPIFITRDRRRVMLIAYSLQADANRALDLSLPAQHLGAGGFAELAFQAYPQRLVWCRLESGDLAALLYDPDEEVLGWALVPLAGGVVEGLCVTSSADGSADILTLSVRRTVNGAPRRMIEEQAVTYGTLTGSAPITEAVHTFAAARLSSGSPTDVWDVPHLAGLEVCAWTEKGELGPVTVGEDGKARLPDEVTSAVIGLFDATHMAETLPIVAQARDGSPLARAKRLHASTGIAVYRTGAGRVAAVERDLGRPERVGKAMDIIRREAGVDAESVFSGVMTLPAQTGHAGEVHVRITPVGGAPLTVTALVPTIEEAPA